MRQRKIKNIDEKIAKYAGITVKDPKSLKGDWKSIFGNDGPLYLEIGCGKGRFIAGCAETQPDRNYLAVEGALSVVIRALEKTSEKEITNVRFILEFIDDIEEYFDENELDGIYLNFSDPWPKERHAKRRLTHNRKLIKYAKVVKPEGFIQFKTDNESLFDFTLEEIENAGLEMQEMTRDLHNSPYNERNICTEYEEKFSATGKNINYVKIRALK